MTYTSFRSLYVFFNHLISPPLVFSIKISVDELEKEGKVDEVQKTFCTMVICLTFFLNLKVFSRGDVSVKKVQMYFYCALLSLAKKHMLAKFVHRPDQ